jgi:hypothetical protein
VGITGHRDVAAGDEAALRAAFGGILERLARTCPHTPLLVISGLAAGADSLAAEEAIARDVPVLACLPMPREEYEKDFSPEELVRFGDLLGKCARTVVASPVREHGYVAAGRFITQYSHLLVAFWDGDRTDRPGGTYDVIAMRKTGRPAMSHVEAIPYLPDVGPVDVVTTPRAGGVRPARAFAVTRDFPQRFAHDTTAAQNFEAMLGRIDTYNVDLERVPAEPGEPALDSLERRTDAIANRLQRQSGLFQMLLLVIAFFAAAFQVTGLVPPLAKVLGLLAAFVAYTIARKYDYENRYQDYRAVSEGLRVQHAWMCAGLRHRLVDNAYLRMQENELQWIRLALRYFYLIYCEGRELPDASHRHPGCFEWVRSQWRYYLGAAKKEARLNRRLDGVAVAALAVGVACTLYSAIALAQRHLFVCSLVGHCTSATGDPHIAFLQDFFTVPVALAAVLAAIFTHFSEKENLAGNERRYERMFHVFDRARRELLRIERGEPGNAQAVIYELGHAALVEHADWLIMRRDRPMKVVTV